jgi:hypothetical protein
MKIFRSLPYALRSLNTGTEPLLSVARYNIRLPYTKIQRPASPGAHRHVH